MTKSILASIVLSLSNVGATQREAVAAVVILEAGGESIETMQAVFSTICNRADIANKTRFEIVVQPGQFSCLAKFKRHGIVGAVEVAKHHPKWREALKIVDAPPVKFQMRFTYFSEDFIWPKWAPVTSKCATIGKLRFYALPFPVKKLRRA